MSICIDCVLTYLSTDLVEYDCPTCKVHRCWDRKKIDKLRREAVLALIKSGR